MNNPTNQEDSNVQSIKFINRKLRFKDNNVKKLVRQAMRADQLANTTDCFQYLIESIPQDNQYEYQKILNQIEEAVKQIKEEIKGDQFC